MPRVWYSLQIMTKYPSAILNNASTSATASLYPTCLENSDLLTTAIRKLRTCRFGQN